MNASKQTVNAGGSVKHGFWYYMIPYLHGHGKHVALTAIGSIITGIGVALQPLFIKYIVDDGITPGLQGLITPNQALLTVAYLCLAYALISIIRQGSFLFATHHVLQVQEGALFTMRSRFFSHIQHLCMRFYDKTPSGDLYNCIMGPPMTNIKNFLRESLCAVPHQIVSFSISMVALFSYDWILTVSMLIVTCLRILLTRLARKNIRKVSQTLMHEETETSKFITDMLQGSEAIKLYSIEDNAVRDFDHRLDHLKQAGITASFTSLQEGMRSEFVFYMGNAVIYFIGAYICLYRGVSTGTLFAFISSMTTIQGVLTAWLNMALTKSSVDVAMEKINAVIEEASSTPDTEDGQQLSVEKEREAAKTANAPCIAFEHVDFGYDNRKIFQNFSCHIRYGESVALVGSSGSGKSTLTKLVLRLYETDAGCVRLHGHDVRNYNSHHLRTSFGVVPQNPFIFRGSIWDNIRIVRPDASAQEILHAMELARVNEFLHLLPNGHNTQIGDGALSLSGGQKQRIAIARAILKNPDILIFDEATSALDNISERYIQEAIEDLMKSHTVLIVAHRLSTIKNVDRILVFDQGQIIQEGSYDLLSQQPGMFRTMLNR